MSLDTFCEYFESIIPTLRKQIMVAFNEYKTQAGYRSVWEHFEDVINPVIIEALKGSPFNIPENDISRAKSKSVYPDLTVRYMGNLYAIDVKSGEDSKDPWYDIARLDTYEEKRLAKYREDYSIVVRWKDKLAPQVVDVYIEPTFKTVGYKKECDGVFYRDYDGKMRPKPWVDFENGHTQWKTKEEFIIGFQKSKLHRQYCLTVEWYSQMTETERQELRNKLDAIDNKSLKKTQLSYL